MCRSNRRVTNPAITRWAARGAAGRPSCIWPASRAVRSSRSW
jgi:hypothetical protein